MLQQKGKAAEEKAAPTLPSVPLTHMDVRLLRKLARHPLRFFFEERLGLDFEWKEQDGEFVLPYFDMERLRKASWKQPLNELLSALQDDGKLPVGSFGEVAIQKIRDEIKNYHEMLEKLNVNPTDIYSIELKASCIYPTQNPTETGFILCFISMAPSSKEKSMTSSALSSRNSFSWR